MIFYTCITNGYDSVPDAYVEEGCRYVLFHDGSIPTTKGPWEYVHIDSLIPTLHHKLPDCPVRKSYVIKHQPHIYFRDPDAKLVWVDAAYNIDKNLVDYSKKIFQHPHGFVVLQEHPEPRTLLEEFNKLYADGFSNSVDITKMSQKMLAEENPYPKKDYKQTINCVVWRHNFEENRRWNRSWAKWYRRGVNRDQIASAIAEHETGVVALRVPMQVSLDNTNRVKKYEDSYNIDRPNNKQITDFQKKLVKIWDTDISAAKMKAAVPTLPHEFGEPIDHSKLHVYTCITNQHDIPQNNYFHNKVNYWIFHNGISIPDTLKNGEWKYIDVSNLGIDNPRELAFYVKSNPQDFFPPNAYTVWIDGCFDHTFDFIDRSRGCFPFSVLRHGGEFSYYDELLEGFTCAFYKYSTAVCYTQSLADKNYSFLNYSSPQCSAVWRQLTPEVIKFNEEWYEQGKYINRDTIPFDAAMQFTGVTPRFYDNRDDCGIKFGFKNKKGRLKKHEQLGDLEQYKKVDQFLKDIDRVTGLEAKLHSKYKLHEFYMRYYGIGGKLGLSFNTYPYQEGVRVRKEQVVIYTCITNGHDKIPSTNYYDPDIRYVCFHDGTIDTTEGPWEYIKLDLDIECPRDLAFYPKCNPHEFFDKGTYTVWVDGCFVHTREFVEKSLYSFPFTTLRNISKFSYYDELLEGFTCAFFPYEGGVEITEALSNTNYKFNKYSSPQCSIVWRYLYDDTIKFNKEWYNWSKKGINRDAIPFDAAVQMTGTKPLYYENRSDSGIKMGFQHKVGRVKKHPQYGEKTQYTKVDQFIKDLEKITKLKPLLYIKYKFHEFYMKHYGII